MGRRLAVSMVAILTGSLSGCITMSYLPEIGARSDERPILDHAVATSDAVLVSYRVTTTDVGGRAVAFDVPRWSRIDLDALSWQPLTEYRDGPGPCRRVSVERTKPPAAFGAPDRDVPILPISSASVVGSAGGSRELIAIAGRYPISVHPRLGYGNLTIVSHDGNQPARLRDAEVCLTSPRYGAWWAVPARVGVAPLTIAADAITLPVQASLLVFFFADRPNWHW